VKRTRVVLLVGAVVIGACSSGSDDAPTPDTDDSVEAAMSDGDAEVEEPADGDDADEDEPDSDEPDVDGQDSAGADADDSDEDEPDSDEPEPRYLSGDSEYLFDQEMLHTFELDLSDEAFAELNADPAAEEYVEGSMTFEGETLAEVGIRYKGSIGAFLGCTAGGNPFVPSGAKTCTKLSMKVKINWNDSSDEFYGQRKIQLHSMNLDPTLMRDRLGYWLFEQAGVPAPRSTHARLMINGEFAGLFALVEQIDGRFTRDRFDDGKGNLYKEMWPTDSDGAVRPSADLIGSLETNEDEDPTTEIVQAFAADVLERGAASDAEAARSVFDEWTDVESTVAYAVVDRAIANDDGVFHWYCFSGPCDPHNFYIYEDPSARRVHFIPWDLDNSFENLAAQNPITYIPDGFGEVQNDCQPFTVGPLPITQRSAACDPIIGAWALLDDEFARIDAEFRAGPFSTDQVRRQLETWSAQIAPVVAEATALGSDQPTPQEWELAVDSLLADIEASNVEAGA